LENRGTFEEKTMADLSKLREQIDQAKRLEEDF
jgi:hypothetical protein